MEAKKFAERVVRLFLEEGKDIPFCPECGVIESVQNEYSAWGTKYEIVKFINDKVEEEFFDEIELEYRRSICPKCGSEVVFLCEIPEVLGKLIEYVKKKGNARKESLILKEFAKRRIINEKEMVMNLI